MNVRISLREAIQRDPRDVWNFITNFDDLPQSIPGLMRVEHADDGAIGRGSRLICQMNSGVRELIVNYWEPVKGITLSEQSGSRHIEYAYRLDPTETETLLELAISIEATGFSLLMLPFTLLMRRIQAIRYLRLLKQVLEKSVEFQN